MKTAIVVHTNSGHTLKFAQTIRAKLEGLGWEVDILGLRVIGRASPALGGGKFNIKSPPDLGEYDTVLFGGPVWALKASPVIMRYLALDVKTLKGKRALCFVTMMFAGGDRALRMMNNEIEYVGAEVLDGEKLAWFGKGNAGKINAAADRICEKLATPSAQPS